MRPGDCEAIDSGAFVSICNHSVYIEVDDRDPMTRRTFAARASRKPILPQSGSLEPPQNTQPEAQFTWSAYNSSAFFRANQQGEPICR